jgi:carbonic anhydrase
MKMICLRVAAGLSLGAASLLAQNTNSPPAYAYEGPAGPLHWGDLSPDYLACKTGREQSPVDILNAKEAPLPPIRFDYKAVPLKLINNGHTVQVNYGGGSSISIGDERYELRQFHFHRPSEEQIDGHAFDMVVHLVHTNGRGEIAVVAILIEKGAANSAIQKIWAEIPTITGKVQQVQNLQINASDFLPRNLSYYTYRGSLTTPPCTEGVIWFIVKTPITASAGQIRAFSAMFRLNARPVQALGARTVSESP